MRDWNSRLGVIRFNALGSPIRGNPIKGAELTAAGSTPRGPKSGHVRSERQPVALHQEVQSLVQNYAVSMPDAVYGLPKNDLDDCDIRRRKIVRALESKSQNCRTSPEPRCTTPALDIPTTKPSFSGDSQIF